MRARLAVFTALLLAVASIATAQQGVLFIASADHNTTIVTGYRVEIRPQGGTTATRTKDLGKPTPSAQNELGFTDPAFFQNLAAAKYDVVAIAYGPGGTGVSAPATLTISPTTPPAPAAPTNVRIVSGAPADENVRYASDASNINGHWSRTADSTAANGEALYNPDASVPKTSAPGPDFFEIALTVRAGVPYHVWFRMRADADLYTNDSLWVQITNAVTCGTTTAVGAFTIILEEGGSAGEAGWGWNDNGYGGAGPHVCFTTDGPQTMRVSQREDGIRVDQFVVSDAMFLTTRPGLAKNDSTIVQKP